MTQAGDGASHDGASHDGAEHDGAEHDGAEHEGANQDQGAAEDGAVGWTAIDTALDQLYPGVEPKHYGTVMRWRLGGPDPLDGISIYRRPDHWHIVSYGMSELFEKESADLDHSGWGFEFTIRVARRGGDGEPMWALNLLQNLARYVFNSGNTFGSGHHIDLNGPINLDHPQTRIRAAAFITDPELTELDTPNGRVEFLQLVGITLDEYEACKRWDTAKVLALVADRVPMLVTDLDRDSVLDDPDLAALVEAGTRQDGSNMGSLAVDVADWSAPDRVLTFGAYAAPRVADALDGRLPFGRGLAIDGPERQLLFRADTESSITAIAEHSVEFALSTVDAEALGTALRAGPGRRVLPNGVTVAIKD
jgi:suppressor of fused